MRIMPLLRAMYNFYVTKQESKMEELQQYLEASAQDVDGTQMVSLEMALQAIQTASNVKMLESLDQVMAELQSSLTDLNIIEDEQ